MVREHAGEASAPEPSVLPVASRALVDACRSLGVDADAILERAGIAPERLGDPDARLPASLADALWREAFAATGDPSLALRAAEAAPLGAYRVVDYLGATGPTLGEGFARVAAYFRIVDPRGVLEVVEARDRVELRFRTAGGGPLPPPAQEYTLAVLLLRARAATDSEVRADEVRFTFPRPADVRAHLRVFGVEPVFAAPDVALALPHAVWRLPTRGADPALFALLDGHARRLAGASAWEGALAAHVRAAVTADLAGREPSLAAVARRLAVSARTLQRRLSEEGATFARIVDEVRRERAQAFLAEPDVSIAEVSFLLGFSEQSAFTRAFRRWTGVSPSEHRQRGHRD